MKRFCSSDVKVTNVLNGKHGWYFTWVCQIL